MWWCIAFALGGALGPQAQGLSGNELLVRSIGVCDETSSIVDSTVVELPALCEACLDGKESVWRVRAQGSAVDSIDVTFDMGNYLQGAQDKKVFTIKNGGEILVDKEAGRSASFLPKINFASISKMRREIGAGTSIEGAAQIEISQISKGKELWSRRVVYNLGLCAKDGQVGDSVSLFNNSHGDNAVILLDVRRSVCVNDEMWRTSDVRDIGNVLQPGNCSTEALVFSRGNTMKFLEQVDVWTDSPGNKLPLDLNPTLLELPVVAFVLKGPFAVTSNLVKAGLAQANTLYDASRCGIKFKKLEIVDEVDLAAREGLLKVKCGDGRFNVMMAKIPPRSGSVNVYYLDDPGAFGVWCPLSKVALISSAPRSETLAHEFGHALFLGPSDGILPSSNLMCEQSIQVRDHLTIGQCFRCNMESGSMLRVLNLRGGPTRSCPTGLGGALCPDLSLDAQ